MSLRQQGPRIWALLPVGWQQKNEAGSRFPARKTVCLQVDLCGPFLRAAFFPSVPPYAGRQLLTLQLSVRMMRKVPPCRLQPDHPGLRARTEYKGMTLPPSLFLPYSRRRCSAVARIPQFKLSVKASLF